MAELLCVKDLTKVYGKRGAVTRALDGVDLSLEAGEYVGIMGASGSGKTTLLNCISTIDTVSAGAIRLDGQDITRLRPKELAKFRRENLGFIFQDFNLLDTLTIGENIALALFKEGRAWAESRGIIIADTKFEFGLDEDGNVVLGDEMLTPDSSRFWPLEGYEPGHGQPSFDKQFVRDWLKANPDSNYDLPQDVIDKTIAKYLEAYELLTGKKL